MTEDNNFSANQKSKSENASTNLLGQPLLSFSKKSLWKEVKQLLLKPIEPSKEEHATKKRKGDVDVAYPTTTHALMVEKTKTCYLKWLDKSTSTFQAYLYNGHAYYRSFGNYLCMLNWNVTRAKDIAMSSIANAVHCTNMLKM